MHALALLSAGASATASLPYFHLGEINKLGIPIQWFGMIVAAGVLIGSTPLRRYAEWHGVSDEHIRSLLAWIMISGFLGAHELEIIAYRGFDHLWLTEDADPSGWWFLGRALWPANWPLMFRFWDGIASFGGFVGGTLGFLLFVWWKRLPRALFADITIVGLLPAFSIGRIGCTVVSDHIGAYVNPSSWYAFLAEDYPRKLNVNRMADRFPLAQFPGTTEIITAWNLGLIELLYLIPVNIVVLWLAFRPSKRLPAGFIAVLTAILYTPVRFFLEFLRPEDTDPRHLGLTFAQWGTIGAFIAAVYFARRILKLGKAAEVVAPSSREAQARLKIILREDEDAQAKDRDAKAGGKATPAGAKSAEVKAEPDDADEPDDGDEPDGAADDGEAATEAAKAEPARPAAVKPAAAKPAGKPANRPSGKANRNKRKR